MTAFNEEVNSNSRKSLTTFSSLSLERNSKLFQSLRKNSYSALMIATTRENNGSASEIKK